MQKKYEKDIRIVENFPKAGISFKDVTPLLTNHLEEVITDLARLVSEEEWQSIDLIVGIESRGFILGAALAMSQKKGFLPVRKKGKLPPPVYSQSYALEYGEDQLEISAAITKPHARVLLVDDVLATGGTLEAAKILCERAGLKVAHELVLINLKFLNNRPNILSLLEY